MSQEANRGTVLFGLQHPNKTSECIASLKETGLSFRMIARATDVSEAAVRNWAAGTHRPRAQAFNKFDDLRFTMLVLTQETGLSFDDAVDWMTSRETVPPWERPLDIISSNPEKVIKAAGRLAGRELLQGAEMEVQAVKS
jgi:phosphoribosyl-ATP pyrophosphohydrolase